MKGCKAILAEVFNKCEARQTNDAWREEIIKYFPSLGMMSWTGPQRTIPWLIEQVKAEKT